MLNLWVKQGESVHIGGGIRVKVAEIFTWNRGGARECRLAIEAPKEIPVHRLEVLKRIKAAMQIPTELKEVKS